MTEAASVIKARVLQEDKMLLKRQSRECMKVSFRAPGYLCLEPVESCRYQNPHGEDNSKEILAIIPIKIAVDPKTEA
jgi:hypothetical protein